jgi:hypothetical protein
VRSPFNVGLTVVVLLSGCGPSWDELDAKNSKSPVEFCRWRERQGMGVSRKCLAIEQRDREERRDARESQEHDDSARASSSRAIDARLAEIRANPKYPELGATTAEAQSICTNERGQWVDQDTTIGCKVGGKVVFACSAGENGTMARCTHWLEGADLVETRRTLSEDHGQPTSQDVANGYRVFVWSDGTELTGDPRGVKITESNAKAAAP